jgi:5-methylthioribose kinase
MNLISENSNVQRQLIKQGQLRKISKKSGEYLQRYLILFDDLFLICQIDRLRRKYILKYKIDDVNTITIIENSDSSNSLVFRLISPHQNDEFIAELVSFSLFIQLTISLS